MMTIIVLVALMAMAMGEMSEASTTSFAMEEESTRTTRMILNNNKSSTKFFMKENNKDGGVSCLDGLYNVPRKEENVLEKKNKVNSEIKVKVKGGSLVGKTGRERRILSLKMWVCTQHIPFHFLYIPWQVEEIAPFWRGGDGNYEWRVMQGPSPPKF